MKKIITVFVMVILPFFHLVAQQQVSIKDASFAFRLFCANNEKVDVKIDTIFFDVEGNNDTIMYQANYSDGTAVLLSGSYACKPILCIVDRYADSPLWQCSEIDNPGLSGLIGNYAEQVRSCFENDTIPLFHKNEWDSLLSGLNNMNVKLSSCVSPLLSTIWGQGSSNDLLDTNAYNYLCPNTSICNNKCPTGCVATSLAQVMNYYKYPLYKKELQYQFDWCNMSEGLYVNSRNYENERNAISILMRVCGYYLNMRYCLIRCSESDATDDDLKDALRSLGYTYSFAKKGEGLHIRQIKNSISNGSPVIMSGKGGYGTPGHSFICDGYISSGEYYHINWGFCGRGDGYYTLDSLCPRHLVGVDYSLFPSAFFNIQPDGSYSGVDVCSLDMSLLDHYNLYYLENRLDEYEPWENVINTTDDLVSIPIDERYPSSWRTIPSGESSEYVAHKSVTLQPGFHAERGSTFSARIVPCSNCDSEEMSSLTQQTMMPGGGNSEDSSMLGKSVVTDSNNEEMSDNRLFPNPSHETITYQGKKVASMGIYDMTGKAVYRWFIVSKSENEIVVNIKDLRPSMYVLLLNMSDGTREVVRFIKE